MDINKALKSGQVPKRGGPKEEEDDVSKELNSMIEQEKKDATASANAPSVQVQPVVDAPPDDACDFPQVKNVGNNQNVNVNILPPPKKDIGGQEKKSDNPSSDVNDLNFNLNIDDNKRSSSPSSPPKSNLKAPKNVKTDKSLSPQPHSKTGKKTEGKPEKCIKQLTFELPVKFKSKDYFKLIEIVKKQNDSSLKEFNSGKFDRTLELLESTLHYLTNVEK